MKVVARIWIPVKKKALQNNFLFGITQVGSPVVRHRLARCVAQLGLNQESRREGWTDAAIMLCKLNKSLLQSSIKVGIHRQKVCIP